MIDDTMQTQTPPVTTSEDSATEEETPAEGEMAEGSDEDLEEEEDAE